MEEEHASFEPGAVLAPRRARGARLALLIPVAAFVVIAWAGLNGPRESSTALASPGPTVFAAPSLAIEAAFPATAIGINVQRLGELQVGRLSFDSVVAIAGWYVPTAITDCPPDAAVQRDGARPFLRSNADKLAGCVRFGTLYASRPDLGDGRAPAVPSTGLAVEIVLGVVLPPELETIVSGATQVVVIGRFSKVSDGCRTGVGCSRELVIDHVAWTPGA